MTPELDLARGFVRDFPTEAADALEGLEAVAAAALLAECVPEVAAEALLACSPGFAADCLGVWPEAALPELLAVVGDATLVRFARRLDPTARDRLLASLGSARRESFATLMSYAARSAGALMDPRPLALPGRTSVAEARRRLRPLQDAGIEAVYVVGDAAAPEGVVGLARLAAAEAHETLADLAVELPARISPLTPAQSLLTHPAWDSARELPVVDDVQGLVGVVRLEALERLEVDARNVSNPAVSVTLALGELYWYMATSLLGVAGARGRGMEHDDER